MTLEEAIKHAEEVAATSCDRCREEHEQLAVWLKELQDIKENSIVISKNSTAWEAAQLIINTKCEYRLIYSKNKKLMNVFDEEELIALGKHLLLYAEIENELKMQNE
nr:MAG TPA: Putative Thiol:disulfide interchange protein [Caudoviricetes sp.]